MYSLYQVMANSTVTGAKLGQRFSLNDYTTGTVGEPGFGIPVAKIRGILFCSVCSMVLNIDIYIETGGCMAPWGWCPLPIITLLCTVYFVYKVRFFGEVLHPSIITSFRMSSGSL